MELFGKGSGITTIQVGQCKQRWGRLNDLACKFCGSYDAALRDQSSGENDNDVMKKALDMFFNDYGCKFTLEHAWRELRHDQKWCSMYQAKDGGKEKRKSVGGAVEGEEEVTGAILSISIQTYVIRLSLFILVFVYHLYAILSSICSFLSLNKVFKLVFLYHL